MIKNILILFFSISYSFSFAQTANENLNHQLLEMRKFFLAEDYANFVNYTYPKVKDMMGGKSNVEKVTKEIMDKMKNEGYIITNLNFKEPSKVLKKGDELQCSVTQIIEMKTPIGLIESESTLIAISDDNGENWTFIDTSRKDKETLLKYFPNLHNEIEIKPKKQKRIE